MVSFVGAALLAVGGLATAFATYSPSTGLTYAWLSSAAFCPAASVVPWNCQACNNSGIHMSSVHYLYNNVTDNYGYVAQDAANGRVYVAFRGSDNIENWISDLTFTLIPYPGCNNCHVHEGFYDCYLALSSQLDTALSSTNPAEIVTTGHSLGAAISAVTAFDLALSGAPLSYLYNYGQPRVGDPTYAAAYTSYVIRGQDVRLGFNTEALDAHVHNGSLIAISPILVKAVKRALAHASNAHLGADARLQAEVVDILMRHSRLAVAKTQKQPLDAIIAEAKINGVYNWLRLTPEHVRVLKGMTFVGPDSKQQLRGAADAPTFSGAQNYRVTHNADPVPHLPPVVFGFEHSIQEIWYNEPNTEYTSCSVTNGEDPTCCDSTIPIDTKDHLTYYNIDIGGLC